MKPKNNSVREGGEEGRHEHPLPHEISKGDKQAAKAAHDEAEKDMDNDPDFSAPSPNDDLDEGESARLGENTELI